MKKWISLLLLLTLLLTGCGGKRKYSVTWLDVFDTVTTVTGVCSSEAEFQRKAEQIHEELLKCHRLFDIYHEYDGVINLKTVNDRAGTEPVRVDERIIQLLELCRELYDATDGKMNVAMGSVLRLWHEARTESLEHPENAYFPNAEELANAAEHMDFSLAEIDPENSTVFLPEGMSLDVGAVAKGWSTRRAAENLPEGWLLNVGGNVCATGPKDSRGTPWVVGIQDPDSMDYLHTVEVSCGNVVTSGDYQRCYTVDGVSYHHIIDPETCMPSTYWRSVTVIGLDSGICDGLSTALFLLPLEEGKTLLEHYSAEAFWIAPDGTEYTTSGFERYLDK